MEYGEAVFLPQRLEDTKEHEGTTWCAFVSSSLCGRNKVPLIDMHRMSERVIKQYGVEESKKLFLQLKPNENPNHPKGIEDNTHFSPLGARIMTELAVEGIRELKVGLAKHLKETAAAARR